jgi:phospholipid/cholesterol/gamma-HCH transport system permease protein
MRALGAATLAALRGLGGLTLLTGRGLRALPRASGREAVRTLALTGTGSLGLVLGVAAATGAVIVIETSSYTERFGARDILGGQAGLSIIREFGPLMVALLMAGWAGARTAAEIGNLALGGQLASLRGLGLAQEELLLAPRLVGTLVAMLLLGLCGQLAAVGGGTAAAWAILGIEPGTFMRSFEATLKPSDLVEGLTKLLSYALAISLISYRAGLQTRGGAEAVGQQVARSVVRSVVAVLVLDAVLTAWAGA